MIEITVKLDDDSVKSAVATAWQREFRAPETGYNHNDSGGTGWQEVMRQVKEHIESLDLSEIIATIARGHIANAVDEAVTVALREKAKQRTKEMMRDGTLFKD